MKRKVFININEGKVFNNYYNINNRYFEKDGERNYIYRKEGNYTFLDMSRGDTAFYIPKS